MVYRVVDEDCIGCGACDYACPTGAMAKTDTFLGTFAIDPYTCDDCGRCVQCCPVGCINLEPAWPSCYGHGCPLSSKRMAGFECSVWQRTCESCGAPVWRRRGEESWICPRCDMGTRLRCPKERHSNLAGAGS